MIDSSTPLSAGWWLKRLMVKLGDQRDRYDKLGTYYEGTNGIPITSSKAVKDAYRRLMYLSRTNYAELVVEAVRERMMPVGFRTGADGDDLGDAEAWRIWQANGLDADAMLVHRAMLSMSDSYVIVGGIDPDTEAPLITVEDPREVIVEADPSNRRRPRAALKVFRDDVVGADRAYLYLPGYVIQAARPIPANGDTVGFDFVLGDDWEWITDPQRLPAPVVPVVRFANRAKLGGSSIAEFEPHLPILDRINYQILQRLEIATMQAFRQRAVKGDLPATDNAGNPINYDDVFAADPGALWQLPESIDIWESGVVDLGPIRLSVRDDVQDLAAVSGTPLFYLTPDAANGSAEGASLARERLIFKVGDRISQTSEPWEQVMSYAFTFAGDQERARRPDLELIWADPERHSMAEKYDAASKAVAAGVPWRTIMLEVLAFSPQQVDRMESERSTDLLALALAGAAPGASATDATG